LVLQAYSHADGNEPGANDADLEPDFRLELSVGFIVEALVAVDVPERKEAVTDCKVERRKLVVSNENAAGKVLATH
jgi:hypothetical protein